MKYALLASGLFLVVTPSAEAQLFRRRVQFVQQQQCYQQPTYQAQYYQPTYQAVAAIPLATIPVTVDLQAYQYSVNALAFQSFRDYQAQKVAQVEAAPVAQQAPANVVGINSAEPLAGAAVLKANCLSCHQKGNNPKSGFSIFDEKGDIYANLPLGEMLERITTDDPSQRMPPKRTLAPHDAMAVLRLASSSGITNAIERVAATEPTKPRNPFE